MNDTGRLTVTFLVGLGVGVGLALLFAPQSGEETREWIAENKAGRHKFLAMRKNSQDSQIEKVGSELREMMTFLKKRKEAGVP